MAGVNFRIGRARERRAGLSWDGNPSGRRAIRFASPSSNGLPCYPATYIWKVYQRAQVTGVGDGTTYYTTFFWGVDGAFTGGTDEYVGAHPYPRPTTSDSTAKWEISTNGIDYMGRGGTADDGSGTSNVVNNTWYSQALVVSASGGVRNHKFYIDLPSTAAGNIIEKNPTMSPSTPSPNCLIWGQAPDNGSGSSWGGYSRWEEQNAIIRGVQVYNAALTESQIVALSAYDYDSEVLAYCTAQGITSLWYLNMNWTLSDISDKSGNGHNPSLVQTNSATPSNWTP